MINTYRRFNELKFKALEKFKSHRSIEDQLMYAVIEISMMNENDVPEHKWEQVQAIINKCRTHKPIGQEGIFRASIDSMTYEGKKTLKEALISL
ncbi:MAG: hypothetical protein NVV82_00530 [Sporocytophaga sp.]|nr:hypothetical protein [Sporocytophaga sp.]